MGNLILGSGILGLLAKMILGNGWQIVPFGRSRFYSFTPALDDNFIIRDARLDDFVKQFGSPGVSIYKINYSVGGQLIKDTPQAIREAWASRAFGSYVPQHAALYLASRSLFGVYTLRANTLYGQLLETFGQDLLQESKRGPVTAIEPHCVVRGGHRLEFDKLVSTIPLPELYRLCGIRGQLPAKQLYYYHIATTDLDFEGANQVLVVDEGIDFFKVTNIAEGRYLFYVDRDIPSQMVGQYFSTFMNDFDILDGTTIKDALPCGSLPDLSGLTKYGIHCVGKHAEWDPCADLGSGVVRLLRLAGKIT